MRGETYRAAATAASTTCLPRSTQWRLAAVLPVADDYSRHITFNDDAMINVGVGARGRRGRVARRSTSSMPSVVPAPPMPCGARVDVILKTQVTVNGVLTSWCAQHDAVTLEPRPASGYEHVSLSGAETVGVVRFLMRQPSTPAIAARGRRRSDMAARRAADPTAGGHASTRSARIARSFRAATASSATSCLRSNRNGSTATPGSAPGRKPSSKRNMRAGSSALTAELSGYRRSSAPGLRSPLPSRRENGRSSYSVAAAGD